MPDFNAFPVNLHWRKDTKFFPACRILIGQFKFPARQPYARFFDISITQLISGLMQIVRFDWLS